MVDLLGESGIPAMTLLIKAGSKLQPERVISVAVKYAIELPENLTVIQVPVHSGDMGNTFGAKGF